MNKEVYCSKLTGTHLYNGKMGVSGTFAFKDSMLEKEVFEVKSSLKLFLSNKNYKQALNEIRIVITECKMLMSHEFDWDEQTDYILQIIDKYTKEDD